MRARNERSLKMQLAGMIILRWLAPVALRPIFSDGLPFFDEIYSCVLSYLIPI